MGLQRGGYDREPSSHHFTIDGELWAVRELDGRGVPGAQRATCLIFEGPDLIRRLWVFPANWYDLDDAALWRLGERSVFENEQVESVGHRLAAEFSRALEHASRAQALLAEAQRLVVDNRAQRDRVAELLERCRAERDRIRAAVQTHSRELQSAGLIAEDASFIVANAVREAVTSTGAETASLDQVARDAKRWCAAVYQAA